MNTNLDEYEHMDALTTKHPQLTKNQLRWIVANKERYGIAHAIKRIGKRLYFHIPTFVDWINTREA